MSVSAGTKLKANEQVLLLHDLTSSICMDGPVKMLINLVEWTALRSPIKEGSRVSKQNVKVETAFKEDEENNNYIRDDMLLKLP